MDHLVLAVKYAAIGAAVAVIFYREDVLKYARNLLQSAPVPQPPELTARPPRRKPRPAPSTASKPASREEPVAAPSSTEAEKAADDEAFAREFAIAKKGTNLTKSTEKEKKGKKSKSKKQNKAEEGKTSGQSSDAPTPESAVTDRGAETPPVTTTGTGAASAVAMGMETDYGSHMAETLRIAPKEVLAPVPREAEWTSVPTKSQKVQKKVERAELTKKQRQRQAQKERYHEMKEEADRTSRVILEKQLRGARIARGEPAKNGESYLQAPAPSKSAWGHSSQWNEAAKGAHFDLLDTADQPEEDSTGPVIANGEEAVNGEEP